MKIEAKLLTGLRSKQEQDEANAVEWALATSAADLYCVWMHIQTWPCKTATDELVQRFAQLGMTHAVLLAAERKA